MGNKVYKIRGTDKQGSGHYLASRGSRKHNGVDLVTEKGELVGSFCAGVVSKIGYPYDPYKHPEKGHLRYVQVTDDDGILVRTFYLSPLVKVGDLVEEGTVIGISQDLTEIYEGITQHCHFELKENGKHIPPMEYLETKGYLD